MRWRTAEEGIPPSRNFLNSPIDPDCRYARKFTTSWVGYRVHLTETCDDGSFASGLLLVKLEELGSRATEEDLVQGLNWDRGEVSEALKDASRRGFLRTPEAGMVALTEEGRGTAHRVLEIHAIAK